MGRITDSFGPSFGIEAVVGSLTLVWVVSDDCDNLIVLVQNSYSSLQLSDGDVVSPDLYDCRHPEVSDQDLDEVTVGVPLFDSTTLSVADEQQRFRTSEVNCEPVTSVELPVFCRGSAPWSTERLDVVELGVVLVDPLLAVAISNENRAVWS